MLAFYNYTFVFLYFCVFAFCIFAFLQMRTCFRSAIETGFIALTYSQLCIINMI